MALRYVDRNPVRAGLIERAVDYRWSSARAHAVSRDPSGLLDMDAWAEICPRNDWAPCLEAATKEDELLARIREATRSGKPIGNEAFVKELERQAGHGLQLRPRGRPRKPLEACAAGG